MASAEKGEGVKKCSKMQQICGQKVNILRWGEGVKKPNILCPSYVEASFEDVLLSLYSIYSTSQNLIIC